jgi:hypothetical protein
MMAPAIYWRRFAPCVFIQVLIAMVHVIYVAIVMLFDVSEYTSIADTMAVAHESL